MWLLTVCYHRGSNWGFSTRGTALTRYVFIECYDSGNNSDSNACRSPPLSVVIHTANDLSTSEPLLRWNPVLSLDEITHESAADQLRTVGHLFQNWCGGVLVRNRWPCIWIPPLFIPVSKFGTTWSGDVGVLARCSHCIATISLFSKNSRISMCHRI
jgi:hypothetical protein